MSKKNIAMTANTSHRMPVQVESARIGLIRLIGPIIPIIDTRVVSLNV